MTDARTSVAADVPADDDTREREERSDGPRDAITRGLDLPEREERELVLVRDRTYELNGPESRTLATVGAFRVVRTEDLRDLADERGLRHLRDQGLVQPVSLGGRDRDVVVLTREGRDVLEARRRDDVGEPRQAFHAGLKKPRELTHDAAVYRAYRRASQRLRDDGADARVKPRRCRADPLGCGLDPRTCRSARAIRDGRHRTDCRRAQFDTRLGVAVSDDHAGILGRQELRR